MAGSKSIQTRDNCIYYTSLHLLFSTIMHLLMLTCLLSECGIWETFRVVNSLVVMMVRVYQFDSIVTWRSAHVEQRSWLKIILVRL